MTSNEPGSSATLNPAALTFVTDRHLATLSSVRSDGTPHAVAIAFTYAADTGTARVITSANSQKVRNIERTGYAAITQVAGPQWLTLEGTARVTSDAASVADAERRYAQRYRPPRENPTRVVIEIAVRRVLGSRDLRN